MTNARYIVVRRDYGAAPLVVSGHRTFRGAMRGAARRKATTRATYMLAIVCTLQDRAYSRLGAPLSREYYTRLMAPADRPCAEAPQA